MSKFEALDNKPEEQTVKGQSLVEDLKAA